MYKILVPVDFTDNSTKASHYALALATAAPQAQLLLLHCSHDYLADADTDLPPLEMTASEEVAERVINRNVTEAEDELEELYQLMRTEASVRNTHTRIDRAFIHGLPEEVILDEAKRFKPDLVIMGTKGESNFSRSFFGTVTTKVVQELNIPVLTIPLSYEGTQLKNVAYASDFDKTDSRVIAQLLQLLEPFRPRLHCVHISKSDSKQDQQNLTALQEKFAQHHPKASINYTLLEGDNVAKTLQEYIQKQQIDLLALTTHKRSGLSSILNPSLAQKLVLESEVPLLVFHSPEEV
ncbi:nucleotide-binding universal stress UspA family protein [Pontibacter aydingkolensis]|uniref:Universal stress protein n=1 Tax=Pontibacter aydingkolensis TaxID=1911536 RepID=A0ABS7CNN3_9BACT|nr:universal stress protein [Pontibacter aydingkolensis]MBW7465467.1 universal stress protein [Pontibacter aydingkolensis]